MLKQQFFGKKATWIGGGVAMIGLLASCANIAYQSIQESIQESKQGGKLKQFNETIDSIPKQTVTIKGIFTQSLEQSELNDGTTKYYVYDPKNLLADYAKTKGQTGISKSFEVCIKGRIGEKGNYGHMGRYPYELWVDKIC